MVVSVFLCVCVCVCAFAYVFLCVYFYLPLSSSVGYCNVSACVDALEAGRSLRLKALLSEYFDKKLDRARLQELQDDEELHPLKVVWQHDPLMRDMSTNICPTGLRYIFFAFWHIAFCTLAH